MSYPMPGVMRTSPARFAALAGRRQTGLSRCAAYILETGILAPSTASTAANTAPWSGTAKAVGAAFHFVRQHRRALRVK